VRSLLSYPSFCRKLERIRSHGYQRHGDTLTRFARRIARIAWSNKSIAAFDLSVTCPRHRLYLAVAHSDCQDKNSGQNHNRGVANATQSERASTLHDRGEKDDQAVDELHLLFNALDEMLLKRRSVFSFIALFGGLLTKSCASG
jgi:hypothetical protein